MQSVIQGLGDDLRQVDKSLWEEFLPYLFLGAEVNILGQTITVFTVKHLGIEILEPNLTSKGNWTASCMVNRYRIAALHSHVELRYGEHAQLLTDSHAEIRRQKEHEVGEDL